MGKVSRFSTGPLPSAAVGTPGVDDSEARFLQSAAQSIQSVANTQAAIAQQNFILTQQEIRRKQNEQRAAQKQLENLQIQTNTAGLNAEFGVAVNMLAQEKREQFKHDTTGALDSFSDVADKMLQERLRGITDPKEALMAEKQLRQTLGSQTQQFTDYLYSRIPAIGKANITKIGDALRLSTNDVSLSVEQVRTKLDEFQNDPSTKQAFFNVHGVAADAEMRKFQSDAVRNYLSKTANMGNLELLDERINEFDDIVEGTDTEEFYSRQRAMALQAKRKQEELAEYQASLDNNTALAEITDLRTRGELTEDVVHRFEKQVLENGGSPSLIKSARLQLTLQGKELERTAQRDVKKAETAARKVIREQEKEERRQQIGLARQQINSQFNDLFRGNKLLKTTTPSQLSDLYANITSAEADGNLTPANANMMRKYINLGLKTLDRRQPEAVQHAKTIMRDVDDIHKMAIRATSQPEVNKIYAVKLNNAYIDAVEQIEAKQGRPTTKEQRQNILNILAPKLLQESEDERSRLLLEKEEHILDETLRQAP